MYISDLRKLTTKNDFEEIGNLINLDKFWEEISFSDIPEKSLDSLKNKNKNLIYAIKGDYSKICFSKFNQKIQFFLLSKIITEDLKIAFERILEFNPKVVARVEKLSYSYGKNGLAMKIGFDERRALFAYYWRAFEDNWNKFENCKSIFLYKRECYFLNMIVLGQTHYLNEIINHNFKLEKINLYRLKELVSTFLKNDYLRDNCLEGLKFISMYKSQYFKNEIINYNFSLYRPNEKLSEKNKEEILILKDFFKIKISRYFKETNNIKLYSEELLGRFLKKELNNKEYDEFCLSFRYSKNLPKIPNGCIKKDFRKYTYSEKHFRTSSYIELLIRRIEILLENQVINFDKFKSLRIFFDLKLILKNISVVKNKEYSKFLTRRINDCLNILCKNPLINRDVQFISRLFKFNQIHPDWIKTFSKKEIEKIHLTEPEIDLIFPENSTNLKVLDNLGILSVDENIDKIIKSPFLYENSLISLLTKFNTLSESQLEQVYRSCSDYELTKGSREYFFFKRLKSFYKKDFFNNFSADFFTKDPYFRNIPGSLKINIKNKKIKRLIFKSLDNLLYYCSIKDIENFYNRYGFDCTFLFLSNEHYKNINLPIDINNTVLLKNSLRHKDLLMNRTLTSQDNDIEQTKEALNNLNISYRKKLYKEETLLEYHTYIVRSYGEYKIEIENRDFYKKEDPLLFKEVSLLNKDSLVLIKSTRELRELASFMNNCLSGYIDKIRSKESIIFCLKRNNEPYLAIEIKNNKVHEVEYRKESKFSRKPASKEDYNYVSVICKMINLL